jgi:hypothetical protein
MSSKFIQIEHDELEELITYYINTEDSEQQSISIRKQDMIEELGYKTRTRYNDLYFTDGSVIDKFNGEHSQEECWELVNEWQPSDEELIKIIEIKH